MHLKSPAAAPRRVLAALAFAATLGAAPGAAQNAPAFHGTGDLPGGATTSAAAAVSADGATVVGYSEGSAGTEATRWTVGGGLAGLGLPAASEPFSEAAGVSGDGSVIAGTAVNSSGGRAFRWTQAQGYVFLGTFSCFLCDPATTGEGISADGLVVVGSGLEAGFLQDPHVNAADWDGGGTGIDDLGTLPGGGSAAAALAASADGGVIVGDADSSSGASGFVWTSGSGMVALPGLPGALFRTTGQGVADDGGTVVGAANSSPTTSTILEPVRWLGPSFSTAENLGALPGQTSARGRAFDASPDGSRIVGTTRDLSGEDVAFLWAAAHGMRSVAAVLADDYGVDVGAWVLHEARSISDVNAAGEFTVVGTATNPAGDPEGFVAIFSPTECNDGADNDSDGPVDFPADPECTAPGDRSEGPDCSDGLDNDGDGLVDLADGDCTGAADLSELPDCQNGIDDDGDGLTDHPADPGCRHPGSQSERPACDDGADNDGDSLVDTADPECLDASDTSEESDCGDGLDNDGDGLVDFPADPDCDAADDPSEDPACSDFVDNDGDGRLDYPAAFPRCTGPSDPTERAECNDGADNDGDLGVDFAGDADCGGPWFDVEAPKAVVAGELLVVDRAQAALYAIDPATGSEQLLSGAAQLADVEDVAVRPGGRVLVATPSGLFEVAPPTGEQTLRSGAWASVGGLPVAPDANGDLVVLDSAGIHRVAYDPAGVGTTTTLVSLPIGTDLTLFTGFTLLLEDDETALTTGFGLLGDGVFRVDLPTGTASKVTPGFQTHGWRDLAVETPGTLLAVGLHAPLGEGVFRIDVATGAVTVLSTDSAWQQLTGVAVGSGGEIYVADSGLCVDDACSGGLVAEVDPVTGSRTVVRSGLFSGALELALAAAPPPACDDGIDNDGDGVRDDADPGCTGASDTSEHDPSLPCDDGIDDDGDGLADFPADPGCRDLLATLEDPQCDDDLDNDGDGGIDWDGGAGAGAADPQCSTAWRNNERARACGLLGIEVALALPLLLARVRRRRAGSSGAR